MNSRFHVDSKRSVLIAANPTSGSGLASHLIGELLACLRQRGLDATVITSLEQIKSETERLQLQGRLEAVVSAGGDGTVSVLANLLPACVPLLIFPLGTENLLAKYWGITNDVQLACNTLMGSRVVHMDVGSANGRIFLVMLSCGFDADVVQRAHAGRIGHIRHWTYFKPILQSLAAYPFPMMQYLQNSNIKNASAPIPWIFLFNVPRYAANLQICPQADPTDGMLDLCTFQGRGVLSGLYYLMQTWRGTHRQLREFQHSQVRSLTIVPFSDADGTRHEIPYQIDGDPGGVLPLTVELHPGRLKLLVPESTVTGDPIPAVPMAAAAT